MTKIQKNAAPAIAASENSAYSAVEMLKQERFRKLLSSLITDYIVYRRRNNAMTSWLNAFFPIEEMHCTSYDGQRDLIENAALLLGLQSEAYSPLYAKMDHIFYTISETSTDSAQTISETILAVWELEINKFFNSKTEL